MTEKLPAQSLRAVIRAASRSSASSGFGIGIHSGRSTLAAGTSLYVPLQTFGNPIGAGAGEWNEDLRLKRFLPVKKIHNQITPTAPAS